jgi:hypothetical protein
MAFLLGQPQLLFFEAEQEVPAMIKTNNTKSSFLFRTFILRFL